MTDTLKITAERWIANLPFKRKFYPLMEAGVKVCTTRSRPYGKPGFKFRGDGRTYRITGMCALPLGYVAENLYIQEGFDSPQGFIDIWDEIHPFKDFDPSSRKTVHFFDLLCDDVHPDRPDIHCDIPARVEHDEHQNQMMPLPWDEDGVRGRH